MPSRTASPLRSTAADRANYRPCTDFEDGFLTFGGTGNGLSELQHEPDAILIEQQFRLGYGVSVEDDQVVVENSAAWGELRASALFEPELRETLRRSTAEWDAEIAAVIDLAGAAERSPAGRDSLASAARLTALVEGLSQRWLSGSIELGEAQNLLHDAIAVELGGSA
jgi:BetI-type transcriptional repressor, C-terminal